MKPSIPNTIWLVWPDDSLSCGE